MTDVSSTYSVALQQILRHITHVPRDVAICSIVVGVVCTVMALIGNALIIVTFLQEKSLRQRQNTFVVTAAILEIILVFLRDVFLLGVYVQGQWPFGPVMIIAEHTIMLCRNSFAIGHVVAVTVYRYALIVHTKAYRTLSKTPVIILVLGILIVFPVFMGVIQMQQALVFNTKGMFPNDEYSLGIENGTQGEIPESNMIPSLVYIGINIMILTSCYLHIYIFIRRSSQRVAGGQANAKPTTDGTANGQNKPALSKRNTTKEVKFVKTMAIVFITFIFSYFTMPVMIAFDKAYSLSHWAYFPVVMINWFSSSVNWVVYSLTHSGFRRGLHRILRCPGGTTKNRGNSSVTDQSMSASKS